MRKILLVEDDVSLGETLTERLRKEYDVSWGKIFRKLGSCSQKIKILI